MLLATNLLGKHSDFVIQGINRLLSFEVTGGGFSLFGKAPANPALTAYGILEFRVIVDYLSRRNIHKDLLKSVEDALARAEAWLLSKESIESNWCQKTMMDWIGRSSCETTTAYIYYALSHHEVTQDIREAIMKSYEHIIQNSDQTSTYVLALHGLTMHNLEENEKAALLRSMLRKRQTKEGYFKEGKETITSLRAFSLLTCRKW